MLSACELCDGENIKDVCDFDSIKRPGIPRVLGTRKNNKFGVFYMMGPR